MNTLVSICIPTFNGERFIAEAMQSAISQTYANLEIVVSDDESKDETLKIIEQFKGKTTIPISIYHHQPNGIGSNWNNCIKYAKGAYIKFLFQDDVLLPNCIEEMVIVLENDGSIGMLASKREFIIDKNYWSPEIEQWIKQFGDLQKNLNLKSENGLSIIDKSVFKSNQFLKSPLNKIGEPSVIMFKKEIVNKVGYFREDLHQILDYEFCYRILKKYKIGIINKVLVQFRLHEMQATNINRKRAKDTGDTIKYQKILYNEYLWYLNGYHRKHFLKKFNFFYRLFYWIKKRIRIT